MELWFAALSGIIGGGTLLLGALVAWFLAIPERVIAGIMAAGAGVLLSTLAFELVAEAAADGGVFPTMAGFLAGSIIYLLADAAVSRGTATARGAAPHRGVGRASNIVVRRSGKSNESGNGAAIAIGALIDGIPESIVMGLAVVGGGGLSVPIVAAVAISNIPEGLGSTAALKKGGTSAARVFGVWVAIAIITVIASLTGYLAFQGAPAELTALVTTIAAGGLLAMICNTMIPEAFAQDHGWTGLWATLGFLTAFVLHSLT